MVIPEIVGPCLLGFSRKHYMYIYFVFCMREKQYRESDGGFIANGIIPNCFKNSVRPT